MKKVDLSTYNGADQFCKMFDGLPASQTLVNRMNEVLSWKIKGKGSQAFAQTLRGLASNIAVSYWCSDDTSRSVYRLCAASCYRNIKDLEVYIKHAHSIVLPSWINRTPSFIQRYSHEPNSTRLP